jgi:hypothetical protein
VQHVFAPSSCDRCAESGLWLTCSRLAPEAAKGAFPTTDQESWDIQEYHFIKGQVLFSYNFTDHRQITTIEGKNLTFYVAPNGTRYVNDAEIVDADYLISTGVFHVIKTAVDPRIPDAKPAFLTARNSTTTSNSLPTGQPTSSSPASSGSSGLSTGAKAGIGVGVALVVLAAIAIGALLLHRKRETPKPETSELPGAEAAGWEKTHQLHGDSAPHEMYGHARHEIHCEGTSGRGEMDGSQGSSSLVKSGHGQAYEMQ